MSTEKENIKYEANVNFGTECYSEMMKKSKEFHIRLKSRIEN